MAARKHQEHFVPLRGTEAQAWLGTDYGKCRDCAVMIKRVSMSGHRKSTGCVAAQEANALRRRGLLTTWAIDEDACKAAGVEVVKAKTRFDKKHWRKSKLTEETWCEPWVVAVSQAFGHSYSRDPGSSIDDLVEALRDVAKDETLRLAVLTTYELGDADAVFCLLTGQGRLGL